MSEFLEILFDPLFRMPFVTGLALAIALSLTGAWLRMRNEWLVALGLSQAAAAGGMGAVALGLPVLAGAFGVTGLAMGVLLLLPRVSNSNYGLLILAGWAGTLLLGHNTDQGTVISETLLRGDLYYARAAHAGAALLLAMAVVGPMPWLSRRLLTERFFPDYYTGNRIPAWPHRTLFAVVVVACTVLGTDAMGVFPAFALFFFPSWAGFVIVDGWARSLAVTVVIALVGYLGSFVAAIAFDQPFGPCLVAALALLSSLRFLTALRRRTGQATRDAAPAAG